MSRRVRISICGIFSLCQNRSQLIASTQPDTDWPPDLKFFAEECSGKNWIVVGPVDVVVLGEAEVVVGQGGDEDDGLDLVETPNPLLAFRPLTADVEQTERQSLSFESMVTRRLLKFNYSRYSSAI